MTTPSTTYQTAMWPTAARTVVVPTERGPVSVVHLPASGATDGPPIVLVHGYHGAPAEFGYLSPLLAERRDVWAVELRGHECAGEVLDDPTSGTTADQLDIISAAVTATGSDVVDVLGLSYGGYLTATWAVQNQPLLRRLILLGAGIVPLHWTWRVTPIRALMSSPNLLLSEERRRDQELRQRTPADFCEEATPYFAGIPEPVRAELLSLYLTRADDPNNDARRRQRARSLAGMVHDVGAARSWNATLSTLQRPVLWLHGIADPLVPFPLVESLVATLPGWELIALDGVGHLPHLEVRDRTAAEILS